MRTVRVYSANPKTADGYNTFIFRRDVARSLNKLAWAPVIDGSRNPIPEGVEVGGKSVRYSADDKRRLVEFVERIANAQKGPVENDDFGHFEITKVFATEVQCHAISTRREIEAVSSAAEIARSMVHFAGSPNEEVKRKKPNKYFEYGLAKIRLSDGVYLVMGEVGIRVNKRPYYDQRVVAKFKVDSEVTSLHGQAQIGESTFEQVYDNRFRLILQGVALYYDTHSSNPAISNQTIRQSPLFSIIIPVYNVVSNLRECLSSVVKATEQVEKKGAGAKWRDHPFVEVICVDDGSTDGSSDILEEYRERLNVQTSKHLNFHVIHRQNSGPGPARNHGLEVATGEWVAFVDADDVVQAGWLERCQRAIDRFPDVDMVRYGQIEFDDGKRCPWPEDGRRVVDGVLDLRKQIIADALEGGFWGRIYRRSKVSDLRFPPCLVGEDWVWKTEAVLRADSLVDAGGILYGYRQRAASVIHSARTAEWIHATMDWPVHVLRAFSDSEKDIDPSLVRRFLADLVLRCEEYCLSGRSNGEDMWSHWCDAMVAVSRMRKVPWWFRIAAGAVSLTRLRLVGYLVAVSYKMRRLRFA